MKQTIHIVCRTCGTVVDGKREADKYFYRDPHTSTGYKNVCKECLRNYSREHMREIRKERKEAGK